MKYVSIDIETTGLDPNNCQVLQIAAVLDAPELREKAVASLPHCVIYVKHDHYFGEAAAFAMNAGLLEKLAGNGIVFDTPGEGSYYGVANGGEAAGDMVQCWLKDSGFGYGKVVAAGKNFASFDLQFLKRMHPNLGNWFHHRVLDPAMLYIRSEDDVPPNTEFCMRCARIDLPSGRHDALEDARNVVRLIRRGLFGGEI